MQRLLPVFFMLSALAAGSASATDVALFKTVSGGVFVQRGGQKLAARVGDGLQPGDKVVTGADGAAGMTFNDNSLISLGPDSSYVIDRFEFDTTTYRGRFDSSLKKGTLSVVSGKIVKQTPGAMTIHTPSAILGARGTEFVVRASGGEE
jgi:hypothetical protein